MEKWFFFIGSFNADIFLESNYSNEISNLTPAVANNKLLAIFTHDDPLGRPVIDRDKLASDFISAVIHKRNFGIVRLQDKFIKKESWLDRLSKFFYRIL